MTNVRLHSTKGNAPATAIAWGARNKTPRQKDFTMDISTSSEAQGYQAVVYAEWGWRNKVPSDDPARWETVVIGVYRTYQEAKDACIRAMRDVIDYIGFCVKTTTQAAVAALAA